MDRRSLAYTCALLALLVSAYQAVSRGAVHSVADGLEFRLDSAASLYASDQAVTLTAQVLFASGQRADIESVRLYIDGPVYMELPLPLADGSHDLSAYFDGISSVLALVSLSGVLQVGGSGQPPSGTFKGVEDGAFIEIVVTWSPGEGRHLPPGDYSAQLWLVSGGTNYPSNAVTFSISPPLQATCGDINFDGRIDVLDAAAVMRHITGRPHLTPDQQGLADLNSSGSPDLEDVQFLLRHIVGLVPLLDGCYAQDERSIN